MTLRPLRILLQPAAEGTSNAQEVHGSRREPVSYLCFISLDLDRGH